MVRSDVKGFQRAAKELATDLKSQLIGDVRVRVLTHTDTDGISSGNILARCLNYYDIPFHISFTHPLSDDELKEVAGEGYDIFFFLDQGTGQISGIERYLINEGYKAVVLDHHPGEVPDISGLFHLNPHDHGLNGAKDVSASGVVYSVVKEMDDRFAPLSEIALIGAIGDRQESPLGFAGVNEEICKQAINDNILKVKEGLKLVPRISKIYECLKSSIKPYLLGISGSEESARKLIERTELDSDMILAEIDLEYEEKLKDAILNEVKFDSDSSFRHALWGPIYKSTVGQTAGPRNIHECVAMLDACEKLGKPEIGFATLFGDDTSRDKALEMLGKYQGRMLNILNWFASQRDRFKITPQMKYIYAGNELESKMIGEALSLSIESGLIQADRPVLGIVDSGEDELKISARAISDCTERGPHIGNVLSRVSREVGGSGGGHDVAAAARIPKARKEEFITKMSKFLEDEMIESND